MNARPLLEIYSLDANTSNTSVTVTNASWADLSLPANKPCLLVPSPATVQDQTFYISTGTTDTEGITIRRDSGSRRGTGRLVVTRKDDETVSAQVSGGGDAFLNIITL